MKFDGKKAAWVALAIAGVGGASGLAGYLVWKKWFKKDVIPAKQYVYDPFEGTGMQGPEAETTGAECAAACTADPQCTAYVVRSNDPEFCSMSHGDPAKEWDFSELSPQTLYVKRFSTDPPLFWTDWGECDQPCGRGIKKRTCSIADKCPGPTSEICNPQDCDMMFPQNMYTKPYPDQKGTESDVIQSTDCSNKCLRDPTCTGIMYHRNPNDLPTPIHCTLFNQPIDELQPAPEATDTTILQVRAPPGTYGSWTAFPSCPCGTDRVERTCTAPAGNVCGGPKYLKCQDVPCAYDPFPGTSMQGS